MKSIAFEKRIYNAIKKKALQISSKGNKEFALYQKNHQRFTRRTFKKSSMDELLGTIIDSQVVFFADFHSFEQNEKNFERILKFFLEKNVEISIAFEFIDSSYQNTLNSYINNQITELEFLESIDYEESWRFPWAHFKVLFELIKSYKLQAIALNSKGTLKNRDLHASQILAKEITTNPEKIIFVLFGEYHLAPNKLPKTLKQTLKNLKLKTTIIHQNLDAVYFKQPKKNALSTIISFNCNEFSIQSSPPWIKYESFLYWHDNLTDDPYFDLHEYLREKGHKLLSEDTNDNFLYLLKEIILATNLDYSGIDISEFNLCDHRQINTIKKHIKKIRPIYLKKLFQSLLISQKSFKVLNRPYYYCPNYSINRLSFLAGLHLFYLKRSITLPKKINRTELFLIFLYGTIFSYFASKIINPYRKCNLYLDFKALLGRPSISKKKKTTYKKVINIIQNPQRLDSIIKNENAQNMFWAARHLGNFFGDILYDHFFISKNRIFNELLNDILKKEFSKNNFLSFYKKIMKDLAYQKMAKRFF